jgi:hypothetical protein
MLDCGQKAPAVLHVLGPQTIADTIPPGGPCLASCSPPWKHCQRPLSPPTLSANAALQASSGDQPQEGEQSGEGQGQIQGQGSLEAKGASSFSSALDAKQHPELVPLSEAGFTLASLLSSGVTGALAPHDERRAVYVLHRAAQVGRQGWGRVGWGGVG